MRPARAIDIAVCTFRRDFLKDTLLSVAKIDPPPGVAVRVIIADNDVTPSAHRLVKSLEDTIGFPVTYVHCPASNISIARNACLEAASGDYLAFVDDDELVTSDWLTALLEIAIRTCAAAVLGPVRAIYRSDAPALIARADFHSTRPVFVDGKIRTGYTCNVLIDRNAPSVRGRRFDLNRGRSGGEDTAYFTDIVRAGGTIEFSERALVLEPVTGERATFSWLARRRFRSGQTHGTLLLTGGASRLSTAFLAAAKFCVCTVGSAVSVVDPVSRSSLMLRAVLHAGVVAGVLGVGQTSLYGRVPTTGGATSHDV
jgi:succinoglycan biosynthesis protein ExoM